MMKRLCLALAGLFAFVSLAQGAGTVPGFSLTPQFDLTGHVAPGCKLYIIQAGTTATPQNAYQDSGLSILQPNPMICDAAGRLSQFFVADGVIKLRLTTSTGTQIFVGDNLLVVGASGGGGGGGTVDPTTILATGDIKAAYGTGILSGFVRANGRTIGSATSGATERANADTNALFVYLWGADANLAVSGGRGASAAADWSANKTLTLPDARGRGFSGLDDMGNTAAGRLTVGYFGTAATVLGAVGGNQAQVLINANLPPYTPAGTVGSLVVDSNNFTASSSDSVSGSSQAGGSQISVPGSPGGTYAKLRSVGSAPAFTGSAQGGSSSAFATVQPTILATYYLKL
jgi:hypothetical protein